MLSKRTVEKSKNVKVFGRTTISSDSSISIGYADNESALEELASIEIKTRECLSLLKEKRKAYIEKLLGKFLGDKPVYLTTNYDRGNTSSSKNKRVKGVLVLSESSGIGCTVTSIAPVGEGYSLHFYPIKKDGKVSLRYSIIYLYELAEGRLSLELCEGE